jgi:glycine cleavage system protein P-like pyridoxal-binding family
MTTTTAIHPFEEAGLGKAPFRYIGAIDQNITQAGTVVIGEYNGVQFETTAGGTCDYCGMAIVNMYRVRSSDGKVFKVGCDCLKKVDIVNPTALKNDVKKAKDAKADARIAKAKETLRSEAVRAALASVPHHAEWAKAKGMTRLDQVEWLLSNGGRSGKTDAAVMIERAAKATRAQG